MSLVNKLFEKSGAISRFGKYNPLHEKDNLPGKRSKIIKESPFFTQQTEHGKKQGSLKSKEQEQLQRLFSI